MIDPNWQGVRKILCVRLDSLGDVLMTTPAIRALKVSHPGCEITLLTSPKGAHVARLVPEVDDVIVYDAPWMKETSPRKNSRPDIEMIGRLRKSGFDAAVIFTVFSQNPLPAALMAFLSDIPLSLAYCRENPYQLLTHWVAETDLDDKNLRHEVRRQLDLVASIGCTTDDESLSLRIPPKAGEQVLETLQSIGVDVENPWVVIHPGASAPSRRYRPDGFAEAACSLVLDHGLQVIYSGVEQEAGLVSEIQAEMDDAPSFSVAGLFNLGEFAAFLNHSPLLISNNSGPVHLAAAVSTPVVDIYALTNPQHTPWGIPYRILYHDVPCKFCYKSVCPMGHHDCLEKVSPQTIVEAALDLLQGNPSSRTAQEVVA